MLPARKFKSGSQMIFVTVVSIIILFFLFFIIYSVFKSKPGIDGLKIRDVGFAEIEKLNLVAIQEEANEIEQKFRITHNWVDDLTQFPVTIVCVVFPKKMNELREFIGAVHNHCKECMVNIYGAGLFPEYVAEVKKWKNVNFFNVFDLIVLNSQHALHYVPASILHTIGQNRSAVYVPF